MSATRTPSGETRGDLEAPLHGIDPPLPSVRQGPPVERVSIGESLRRRPLLVLTPAVILAVLGGLVGLHRSPIFTATSQVVVQPIAPSASQLPGAIQSAQDLATNQSRLIGSNAITAGLAQQFHTTSSGIAARLSATPIPSSSIIKIGAEGASAGAAVALANAAAVQFSQFATSQARNAVNTAAALHTYETASQESARAQAAKRRAEGARPRLSETAQVQVAVAADKAQVRQQALAQHYQSLVESEGSAPTVSPFVFASSASSNRASGFETFVLAGGIAGLLIGAALATLLANRGEARRFGA